MPLRRSGLLRHLVRHAFPIIKMNRIFQAVISWDILLELNTREVRLADQVGKPLLFDENIRRVGRSSFLDLRLRRLFLPSASGGFFILCFRMAGLFFRLLPVWLAENVVVRQVRDVPLVLSFENWTGNLLFVIYTKRLYGLSPICRDWRSILADVALVNAV